MALPKGMQKSSIAMKKSSNKKTKGTVSKAAIGAPVEDTPTPNPNPNTPPPPSPVSTTSGDGKNWIKPKTGRESFTPYGIADDSNWHHDDAQVVSQIQMNADRSPLEVMHYWMSDDGAALKRAQPYDPQHGDYSGFGAPGHPGPDGPTGYVNAPGQSTPKTKTPAKPSGDQHAGSYSAGSAEAIRFTPGSFASGVTNGMTNRDKYVK